VGGVAMLLNEEWAILLYIISTLSIFILGIIVIDIIITNIKKKKLDNEIKRSRERLSRIKPKGKKYWPDGSTLDLK
jgi:hypothetical protein